MVTSHTYAHRDFFKNNRNNMRLSRTNRKQMICERVNRATRIRRYLSDRLSLASSGSAATSCLGGTRGFTDFTWSRDVFPYALRFFRANPWANGSERV